MKKTFSFILIVMLGALIVMLGTGCFAGSKKIEYLFKDSDKNENGEIIASCNLYCVNPDKEEYEGRLFIIELTVPLLPTLDICFRKFENALEHYSELVDEYSGIYGWGYIDTFTFNLKKWTRKNVGKEDHFYILGE